MAPRVARHTSRNPVSTQVRPQIRYSRPPNYVEPCMEVLGHSSIRVTMDIYTFVRLDSQRSAFDRVGDALRGDCDDPDDDDGAASVPVAV